MVIGGLTALHVLHAAAALRQTLQPGIRIHTRHGDVLHVRPRDLTRITLWPSGIGGPPEAPWELTVPHRGGRDVLTGREGVRALGKLLPAINRSGAGRRTVRAAVTELEEVGAPAAYFTAVETRARRRGKGWMPLPALPRDIRLALEMAAHEDQERVALEGELAWLETAWRVAAALLQAAREDSPGHRTIESKELPAVADTYFASLLRG